MHYYDYKITYHPDLDIHYLLWVKNENGVFIHDSWHRTEQSAQAEANDMGLLNRV